MKPTDQILKSLVTLKNNKDFIEVIEWLKQEKTDSAMASCHADHDIASRWIQGHVQLLEMFLDIAENAELKLNKRFESKDKTTRVIL